ncbi:MAG: hypothetical protein HYS06_06515 [Methylocystis sp.]|nr:hypothetical protein [Methylocystis sp.]
MKADNHDFRAWPRSDSSWNKLIDHDAHDNGTSVGRIKEVCFRNWAHIDERDEFAWWLAAPKEAGSGSVEQVPLQSECAVTEIGSAES